MRLAAALLLLRLAAPAAGAQQGGGAAAAAVRLSELRNASDEALVRLFFGRVRAFPYVGHRDRDRLSRVRRGTSLWFYSQARATDRAGICRTDRLIVTLEVTGLSRADDPILQPREFELQPTFIIENRGEARRSSNAASRGAAERDAACRALDPRRDGIPADYPYQLMRAIELVEELGAAARAGRALVPIDCSRMYWNGDPPADEASCLRELALLREHSVVWVSRCEPRREAPGGCIRVMTRDWWVEFDMNLNQSPLRAVIVGFEDMSQVNWAG